MFINSLKEIKKHKKDLNDFEMIVEDQFVSIKPPIDMIISPEILYLLGFITEKNQKILGYLRLIKQQKAHIFVNWDPLML